MTTIGHKKFESVQLYKNSVLIYSTITLCKSLHLGGSVTYLCKVLYVPVKGYYAWRLECLQSIFKYKNTVIVYCTVHALMYCNTVEVYKCTSDIWKSLTCVRLRNKSVRLQNY